MKRMMKMTAPPTGRLIQKHQRQVVLLVKAPPINGPAKLAIENVAPSTPMYMARFWGATDRAMMVYTPLMTPAPPIPVNARPTMRVMEFCETAQISEPISRTEIGSRKTSFSGQNRYSLPQMFWKTAMVMKKPDPYHPTSASEWKSAVIWGIAVEMMVESRATRNMLSSSASSSPMTCTPVR